MLPGRLALRDRCARGWRVPVATAAVRAGSRRLTDVGPAIALAALAIGVVLIAQAALGGAAVFWPLVLGVVGIGLVWRQADEAQRERWLDSTGRVAPGRIVFGRGGWASWTRLGLGLLLVVSALVLFALEGGSLSVARDTLLVSLLAVVGVGLVAGPWIYRLAADLTAERAERVRTQDRADVAAHLHDSVLQTLALIQKNAHDAPLVARLARSQERDLRAWLYSEETADERTVAGALRAAAAEVEDAHGVAVEVVVVGDRDPREALAPIVQRDPRGGHQRRQARRRTPRRRLRRGHRRRGRRVRPRPRCRLRPRRGPRRPLRRPQQHPRPDGPSRRHGRDPLRARRGHRGAAAPRSRAAGERPRQETTMATDDTTATTGAGQRPWSVDDHAMFRVRRPRRARGPAGRRGRRRGRRRRLGGRRGHRAAARTSSCSTSTCPAAGERR